MLATENTWTRTILHVCVLKAIKYAELQCLKNAVSTFTIAKWAYKSTIMSVIPAAKTRVHFKMTSLNSMEWCLSLFSVVYILCVRPPSAQRGASSRLPELRWNTDFVMNSGVICFAWCHLSAPRFLPTGSRAAPLPPRPPAPPPVLEHGDFTLLLCKACFSVWVWQTHGFLRGEVTEDTQQRRILFLFVCYENIQLSHIMTNYELSSIHPSVDCKLAKVTLPRISLILLSCTRWIKLIKIRNCSRNNLLKI